MYVMGVTEVRGSRTANGLTYWENREFKKCQEYRFGMPWFTPVHQAPTNFSSLEPSEEHRE